MWKKKARAKDAPSTSSQNNQINANVIEKRYGKNNKGFKPKKTTSFKKKTEKKDMRNITCFVCGKNGHMAKDCHFHKSKDGVQPKKKAINVIIGEASTGGYGNPPVVFSACQSTDWWVDTGANVHVCSDIFLFSFYQAAEASSVLMRNGSHVSIFGVGTVDLRLTSGKIVHLKNTQHAPTINKNLVSGSLLYRDGYKLVFESNKIVLSKFGNFVGKGYESGGLFRMSTLEYNLNVATGLNKCEADIWHSRFCHIGFDSIARMSRLDLIPKCEIVKGSKCQTCVQAKQPRKPFKGLQEEKNLAPLDLIHSDLCEMNGLLTK